jgi:hypothetical protein
MGGFAMCVKLDLGVLPKAGLCLQVVGMEWGPAPSNGVKGVTAPRGLTMREKL